MALRGVSSFYEKYERHIASVSLFGGFVFDILTLRRADTLWENFWVILHLSVVAVVIILLNRRGRGVKDGEFEFWLLNLIQFSFGGLLSAFLILYFRSATFSVSWPFLLLLFVSFIANERFKRGYERLIYQVSFFYLTLLLFFIFFLPVILGVIGPTIFVLSGLTSLVVFRLFYLLLKKIGREKVSQSLLSIRLAIFTIFALTNLLYFANVIPPIPLSLRDAGIYHSVDREANGDYILRRERRDVIDYFRLSQKVGIQPGQTLFAYTAIFSPAKFSVDVIHDWQYFDEKEGRWTAVSKISLPTKGGRDQGYRTYSYINVTPGKWRVSAETERGQILGRIGFVVEYSSEVPELVTEIH